MTSDKSFFTFFEDFNGPNVTFGDGSVAHVREKGSVSILECPHINGVLFVNGLKVNVLSISQIYDSDFKVNC